jgi:RNA recognition motif-containing protein
MGNKVFCGGLSWGTDELGLQMAMTDFGPVKEVKIVTDRDTGKSKGFGFVTFEDSTGAEAAIKAASISLDSRTVNIQEANDKPRGGGGRRGGGGGGGGGGGYDDRGGGRGGRGGRGGGRDRY